MEAKTTDIKENSKDIEINASDFVTEDNKEEPFDFGVGDTVRVVYRITEGDKTRNQPYEGVVIGRKGSGISKTFMVRRIGAGTIGVERIFPLFSPNIVSVEVVKKGKPRRAKLFYLRGKKGKAATFVREPRNTTK